MTDEVTGYLHNLSPVKKSDKTNYFDVQVQTDSKVVRGVCFSPQKHSQFASFCKNKSPVKITNITIKDKHSECPSILMNNQTQLETAVPTFEVQKMPPVQNISSLSPVNDRQVITIKAKIVQLSGVKVIGTRYGPKKKREGFLVDPYSSIKIVLWENFTNEVTEGETYNFINIKVRKDSSEIYVNTPPQDCSIVLCSPFDGVLAIPAKLPDSFTTATVVGEIQGISNFNQYISCIKCHKKIQADDSAIVKCENCNMKQKKMNCGTNCHLQCLITTDNESITVTMFDDIVKMAFQIGSSKSIKLNEDNVIDAILNLPEVEISYNKSTKIVTEIKKL